MKTPVSGIVILGGAELIERPWLHRGIAAIVRKSEGHGIAGAAIGAVDIRIAMTAIGGIEEFSKTIVAYGQIRRNTNSGAITALRLANREILKANRIGGLNFNCRNDCGRRGIGLEGLNKRLESLIGAFEENLNAFLTIQHPAGQRIGASETKDEGAKSHALHDAATLMEHALSIVN